MAVTAVPESFRANSDRIAQPAGIICEPGKPASRKIGSKGMTARSARRGTGRRTWCERCGAQVKLPDIGESAMVGREPTGRSSSARRGKRAKPSSLRTARRRPG